MKKYNLTFWQIFFLPLLWVYWKLSVIDNKKTWHEVKKGMEKHEHKYTIPHRECGYNWMKCEHEGCNMLNEL